MKKDNKDKIFTCHGCDYYYCDMFMGIREKYPTRHCDYKSHRDCWFNREPIDVHLSNCGCPMEIER